PPAPLPDVRSSLGEGRHQYSVLPSPPAERRRLRRKAKCVAGSRGRGAGGEGNRIGEWNAWPFENGVETPHFRIRTDNFTDTSFVRRFYAHEPTAKFNRNRRQS